MFDLHQMFHRHRKYLFYLLAIYVLGWGFTPYQTIFLGLILGTVISFYNLWFMVRKSKQFDQALQEGRKVRSLGTASRMASAGVAVLIALQFPEYVHLVSVVCGLMTIYVVIMIDFLLQYIRA
ncbi:ATP synthase subunit I [Metabacillus arenae]|uniref:ATP synthase subunit I n=1 Tax=Metabacillus arenae TaxID=2771434 RepID=A0A926NKI0_9BACI|nr:ATP synthase subunit I [Metabacillus arenae]MBD1383469.1 ATP synthase subunit I [Metabacillus arenae]